MDALHYYPSRLCYPNGPVSSGLQTKLLSYFVFPHPGDIVNSRILQFTIARFESFRTAVFTSPLVTIFNGGRSTSSEFPNSQRASATATFDSQ
jgi:hypothetical protein